MGIPGFFRAIIRAHPSIVCARAQVGPVARCYVDFNAVCHPVCATHISTGDEPSMIQDVIKHMRNLVRVAAPAERTYLATDGVPPLAKMQQQRRRRFISAFVASTNLNQNQSNGTAAWDRSAISPGTAFMANLSAAIKGDVQGEPIELWDDAEYGEGEGKIFQHLRDEPPDPKGGAVVINGLDADLICLALLSPARRIFLMREPDNFRMPPPRIAAGGEDFLYLDVDTLRTDIERTGIDIASYVTLCMLIGNDFLPALGPLRIRRGGIDVLTRALAKVGRPIVTPMEPRCLDVDVLAAVLAEVETVETKHMVDLHRWYQNATPPPTTAADMLWEYFPLLPPNKRVLDVFGRGEWRANYRRLLFPGRDAPREAAECYLEGLRWNLNYYLNGYRTVDVNAWHYPYPYGPLAGDLMSAAAKVKTGPYVPPPGTLQPFTPHECLLLILPPASAGLLPTWAKPMVTDVARGCTHMYPTRFGFHTYLRNYMHEAVPQLPPFDTASVLRQTRRAE